MSLVRLVILGDQEAELFEEQAPQDVAWHLVPSVPDLVRQVHHGDVSDLQVLPPLSSVGRLSAGSPDHLQSHQLLSSHNS